MFTSPCRWLPWGLVLTVCLVGCAETTVTYTPLNTPPHALHARAPEQIQVFSSAPPERPHVDVGLISVEEGLVDETPASLIADLRQSAAQRGCDALQLAPPSTTTRPTGPVLSDDGSYQVYSATCIVYTTTEPGDATATFAPPKSFPDGRRTCVGGVDFDQHRNCVLDSGSP
jgi:hypothetical protein